MCSVFYYYVAMQVSHRWWSRREIWNPLGTRRYKLLCCTAPLIILFLRDPTTQRSKQFLKISQLAVWFFCQKSVSTKMRLVDFSCLDLNRDWTQTLLFINLQSLLNDLHIIFLSKIMKIILKIVHKIYAIRIDSHSSEIRGLCLMKWPGETLQNLPYFIYTKTQSCFFHFSFPATLLFP